MLISSSRWSLHTQQLLLLRERCRENAHKLLTVQECCWLIYINFNLTLIFQNKWLQVPCKRNHLNMLASLRVYKKTSFTLYNHVSALYLSELTCFSLSLSLPPSGGPSRPSPLKTRPICNRIPDGGQVPTAKSLIFSSWPFYGEICKVLALGSRRIRKYSAYGERGTKGQGRLRGAEEDIIKPNGSVRFICLPRRWLRI